MKPIASLLLLTGLASAYNMENSGGLVERRTDFNQIQFLVNVGSASATNANGVPWVTTDSNVMSAVTAAMDTWSSVPTAQIHFATPQATDLFDSTEGTYNIISFDSSAEAQDLVNGAVAVTYRIFNPSSGDIIKTDILFNSSAQFSTTLVAGTYDLQSTLTHELGHTLGANHSGVFAATMFQAMGTQRTDQARLKADDLALATALYPAGNTYGTIAGSIQTASGAGVRGALISAQNPSTGLMVGSMSSVSNGSFSFQLPPGDYLLWAEPLAGQIQPENVALTSSEADTGWQPVFYGGFGAMQTVTVTSGQTATVNLTANPGTAGVYLGYAGAVIPNPNLTELTLYTGPTDVPAGQTVFFIIDVPGIGSDLTEADLQFLGPVALVPGSLVSVGNNQFQMTLNVSAVSSGSTASMLINYNGVTGAFSGGLIVQPLMPSFSASGVTNAFSYANGGVAPGEIVSIFGTNLGPSTGVTGSFSGGMLSTTAGGVTVTFDGQPAPIFYAGPGQVNVQVPFEIAGKSSTSVVINNGIAGPPIAVPVVGALPGLFPSAMNYTEGGANSASNRVTRGNFVILYVVGMGQLSVTPVTGQLVPGADASASPVTVTVGTQILTPAYAGASPGFVGLEQVNVQIPASLPAGSQELSISVNGQQSQSIALYLM